MDLLETGNETPRDGKPDVGGVVDLSGETIPAINENSTLRSDNGLGVLDGLPRDLGECLAPDNLAPLHGTEAVLLAVAAVPNPIPEEVSAVHGDKGVAVPTVLGWSVVGQVDGAVAVGQRDASKVPEDEHETPFLIVHVPSGDDELLALGASVGVQIVSHDEEHDFTRDVAVPLVLASSSSEGQDQENEPRHADLEEHLEVKDAEQAGVQLSTHEEIIDGVASHAVLLATVQSGEVGNERDDETAENGDRQKRTKLVNGVVHGPDTSEVQNTQNGKGEVQADVGIAVVWELLVVGVGERLSVTPDTREETVASTLEDQVRPVPSPSLEGRECASVDVVEELLGESRPALSGDARREFAVIVGGTNPHVPHENGEADHHHGSSNGASKLEFARVVDLGVLANFPSVNNLRVLLSAVGLARALSGARSGDGASTSAAIGGRLGLVLLGVLVVVPIFGELASSTTHRSRARWLLSRNASFSLVVGSGFGGEGGLAARAARLGWCLNHTVEEFLLSAYRRLATCCASGLLWCNVLFVWRDTQDVQETGQLTFWIETKRQWQV